MLFESPETLRRRRWQRDYSGYAQVRADVRGIGQVPEIVGGETAAFSSESPAGRIAIGVTTGVLIWLATRLLDRAFGLGGRK